MIPRSFFEEMQKCAEEGEGRRYLQALKHVGVGMAGLGAGVAAGRGAGHLLGKVTGGHPVPGAQIANWVLPAATGAAGLSYSLWKADEAEKIRSALQNPQQ
jgi:hypothetical protein